MPYSDATCSNAGVNRIHTLELPLFKSGKWPVNEFAGVFREVNESAKTNDTTNTGTSKLFFSRPRKRQTTWGVGCSNVRLNAGQEEAKTAP
jgi:hypothetical protein